MNVFKDYFLPAVACLVFGLAVIATIGAIFPAHERCPCPAPSPPAPPAPAPKPRPGPSVPIPDSGPHVLVSHFHAAWCGPCRAAEPTVKQLEAEGYRILHYDVDTEDGKAWQHVDRVTSIPTFIVGVDGEKKLRTHSVSELADWLHKNHPRPRSGPP